MFKHLKSSHGYLHEKNRQISLMPIFLEAEAKKKRLLFMDIKGKNHKQFVKDWFEGFSSAVHSDADSFFGALYAQNDVEPLLCNAHARRKF